MGRDTTRSGEVLSGVNAQAGQKFMSFKITLTASPKVITFAGQGLPNMADNAYRVVVGGEMAVTMGDNLYVDESTITPEGFSIVGGTGAEIAHVWIHGNVAE